MKNTTPQLILVLDNLNGLARSLVSAHVQAELFKLGYIWTAICGDTSESKVVQNTNAETLRILSPSRNRLNITANDMSEASDGRAVIFSSSQTAEFLRAAAQASVIRANIHGVEVTIRGDSIDLDPSRLLRDVSMHAKQLQRENFGS